MLLNTLIFLSFKNLHFIALFVCLGRLSKRWVASHLFSACLVEEAVELVVAHLFLKPLPFYAPCSRISGFLRSSSCTMCKALY